MDTEARLKKLRDWIEIIKDEIYQLILHNYIFLETRKIIGDSERLSAMPSHFFHWMALSFVHSASMFVRRQLDTTKNTVSFIRLLQELSRPPLLITREYVVKNTSFFWQAIRELETDPEKIFDKVVGVGKAHLERAQILSDIKTLKDNGDLITNYANHFIAHYSACPYSSEVPRFSQLNDCLDTLEALLQTYYFLIKGIELPKLDTESRFDYDWKQIFRFAWIEANPSQSA